MTQQDQTQNQTQIQSQAVKAQQALEALNQAWEYYTPQPIVAFNSPAYDDTPLAA